MSEEIILYNDIVKKFLGIVKFFFIIFFGVIYYTSVHSASNYKQYMGQGELKLSKSTFDLIEFYFSTGKYGEIYNNPEHDWEREMIKSVWKPMFMIISKNGKGRYWYYAMIGSEIDTTHAYLAKARNKCTKQGYGECFVFAIKDKVVWQNGINPKKGTKIKKKEARKGREIYNATGDYLEITTKEEDVYVNGCRILLSIQTSNGVINVIDKVILL